MNEESSSIKSRTIELFNPGKSFPSISITGSKCKLDCAHCAGKYLEHMLVANTPEKLLELCKKLDLVNATGVLISGGCDHFGHVMLDEFYEVLHIIKQDTNLILNVHTGIITNTQSLVLAKTGIDAVSIDIIGDSKTIHNVYGLKHSPIDYENSLIALKKGGIKKIVPHVCVGLNYSKIMGEFKAIDMISKIDPSELVFIILTPTTGTRMAKYDPPKIKEVIQIIDYAKGKLNNAKLYLGCMRPRSKLFREYNNHLELEAINAGVAGLVLPSKGTISFLKKNGFQLRTFNTCCAV